MLCLVFTKPLHCGLISQVLWFVQMHHFRDERLSSKNQNKKNPHLNAPDQQTAYISAFIGIVSC